MFRSRKTKIVSTPVEEVLEVVEPMFEPTWDQDWEDEDPWEEVWEDEEPELYQIANIEFLTLDQVEDEFHWGKLIDYDGNQYEYQWDDKAKRIMRLVGIRVDKLTWDLCNDVLHKYFIKPESTKAEEPIGPQIEQAISKIESAIKNSLNPVANSFKNLEGKLDKAITARPAQTPVQAAPAPRPQTVQSVPMADAPAMSVADDDISMNAMKFLQQSDTPDLGIDYMSL